MPVFNVGGSGPGVTPVVATVPPRDVTQVPLRDAGDIGRGIARAFGFTAPNPPRTAQETPGPLGSAAGAASGSSSVGGIGNTLGLNLAASAAQLAQQGAAAATVGITETWRADP